MGFLIEDPPPPDLAYCGDWYFTLFIHLVHYVTCLTQEFFKALYLSYGHAQDLLPIFNFGKPYSMSLQIIFN